MTQSRANWESMGQAIVKRALKDVSIGPDMKAKKKKGSSKKRYKDSARRTGQANTLARMAANNQTISPYT